MLHLPGIRPFDKCARNASLGTAFGVRHLWSDLEVLDGPIKRDVRKSDITTLLMPELRHGDLVIVDKLSNHKGGRVGE